MSDLPAGCMNQSEVSDLPAGCMNQSEVSTLPAGCINQSDEKGGVAVSITALLVWLSILIKPSTFSIQRGDTRLRAGGASGGGRGGHACTWVGWGLMRRVE